MADPQFFKRSGPLTLRQISALAGAEVAQGSDPDYRIDDVAALKNAGEHELSFLDNIKYKDDFIATKAGAVIVHPKLASMAPKDVHLIISPYPYKSYALTAQAYYPDYSPEPKIDKSAIVHETAKIGENCLIEAGVYIGANVTIGKGCRLEANAVIDSGVEIGAHCRIGSNSTISHAIIDEYSRIYPGVRIGQDGFGFAIDPKGHIKVPQLGRVLIGQHVEIGANTCIDRGAGPDTVIGDGTWIDNLVQIGHNVKIGRGCIIVSQVGISGSTVLGDFVAIGGQGGVAGHLEIGSGARIAAQSGVMRNVPAGEEQMGYPAMPIKQYMKQVALLKRLIKKEKSA